MSYSRTLVLLTAVILWGCPGLGSEEPPITQELPETPTFTADVKPILDRLCTECHSVPPTMSAPATLRLDVCETIGGLPGASAQALRIQIRTIDELGGPMPPATYPQQPTPDDIEILTRWIDQGANCDGTSPPANNTMMPTNNGVPDMGMDLGTMMPDLGTDTGGGAGDWTFADTAELLRTSTCGNCHAEAQDPRIDASMTDAEIADSLGGTARNGMDYIVPGNKVESELYRRLSSTEPSVLMPQGGQRLPEYIQVGAWIDDGAPGFMQ